MATMFHQSQTCPACGREAEQADLANLAELWVTSWQETMPAIDFLARSPWFLDHLRKLEAAGAITLCAFELLGLRNSFDPRLRPISISSPSRQRRKAAARQASS